jgi:hypothetical protein
MPTTTQSLSLSTDQPQESDAMENFLAINAKALLYLARENMFQREEARKGAVAE